MNSISMDIIFYIIITFNNYVYQDSHSSLSPSCYLTYMIGRLLADIYSEYVGYTSRFTANSARNAMGYRPLVSL